MSDDHSFSGSGGSREVKCGRATAPKSVLRWGLYFGVGCLLIYLLQVRASRNPDRTGGPLGPLVRPPVEQQPVQPLYRDPAEHDLVEAGVADPDVAPSGETAET